MSSVGGHSAPGTLPQLVRICGFAADGLSAFGVPELDGRYLEPISALAGRGERARERLVDELYEAIGDAPPERRKALLKLKRDAFNSRPLPDLEDASQEEGSAELLDGPPRALELVRGIVELDRRRKELEKELRELLARRRLEERKSLVEALRDPELRRGIALASPLTVQNLYRLERKAVGKWGKRERRLELSGIRFLSRAAVKTSPYSTLTRSALGVIAERSADEEERTRPAESPGAELIGGDESWERHARLRLKRFLPEGDIALLSRCEDFVRELPLALNDTFESLGEHRYQFLRPVLLAPKKGELLTFSSIMLKAKLQHPLLARLAAGEIAMPRPYEEMLGLIRGDGIEGDGIEGDGIEGEGAEGEGTVDRASARRLLYQLIEAGILSFVHAWPVDTLQCERDILHRLRELAPEAAAGEDASKLAAVRVAYERLIELLEEFSTGAEPVATLRALDTAVDEAFQHAAAAADLELEGERIKPDAGNYYEDVHLTHALAARPASSGGAEHRDEACGAEWGACLRIEPSTASAIDEALRPLNRFNHLLHRRHEVLATLAAFMQGEWPGRDEVPVIEAFTAFQEHWRSFKAWRTRKNERNYDLVFNPLDLDVIRRLRELRKEVMRGIMRATVEDDDGLEGDGYAISPAAMLEATGIIPEAYAPPCGPCAFLQPSDAGARRWVLNRLYEGTGRYASRFAAAMPEAIAGRWTECQRSLRPPVLVDGERAATLDLWTANFDTLNLHGLQTDYVLALPGNHFAYEPSRIRRLEDLRIRFRPDRDAAPRLVDSSGQLLCPVYLGGTGLDFSPPVVEMLAHLGPEDLKTPGLPVPVEERPDGQSWPRLRCGPIILRRRHWRLETAEVHERTRHLGHVDAMLEINRWRFDNGLPADTFLIEQIAPDRYKPQYVDFSSPLFTPILRRCLEEEAVLSLSEALPRPDALPRDAQGKSWNFEIQFESAPPGDRL